MQIQRLQLRALVLEVGDVALGRFGQVVELLPRRSLVHPIAVRGLVGVDHVLVSAHLVEQMAQRLALKRCRGRAVGECPPTGPRALSVAPRWPGRRSRTRASVRFQDFAPNGQPRGGGQVLGQQPTFKVRCAEPAFHHGAVGRQPHTCGVGRLPSNKPRAPSKMLLPEPVSPVKTWNPSSN